MFQEVATSIASDGVTGLSRDAVGLFEASFDCVKLVSLEGSLLAMNANGVCLMEIDDFDALRGLAWSELWPAEQRALVTAAVARAASGEVARFSADCPTAKGTLKSWDVVVSPVFGGDGRPAQLVSISQDVTARRVAEAQAVLLAGELEHRIVNIFAVVDGLIAASARGDNVARPFADTLRSRLRSLGQATAYVSPSATRRAAGGERHTLLELLGTLLRPFDTASDAAPRLVVAGDDAPVGQTAVTALALIANELATNALKYGSLRSAEGRVDVTVRRSGADIVVVWSESGGAGPSTPEPRVGGGFGSRLLEGAVARQLGGEITREWRANGLRATLRLPVERLSA